MKDILQWIEAYPSNNYADLIQALVFAGVVVSLFFHHEERMQKLKVYLLSFILSFNTANIIAAILYTYFAHTFQLSGLNRFFLATFVLLLPVILIGETFRLIVGKKNTAYMFVYAQFFIANCLGMLLAYTVFQRMMITVILSLAAIYVFRKEIQYMAVEKTMLSTDRRFIISTLFFMLLLGAEAEMPRIVLDGTRDGLVNHMSIAVSFIGVLLTVMYNIIMKFNFYSIRTYESYLREHYNDELTSAKNLSYLLDYANDQLAHYRREHIRGAVFYTDIINFRDINILHGYETGSQILCQLSLYLQTLFPDGIIIRMSADHFSGIIPFNGAEKKFEVLHQKLIDYSLDESLDLNVGLYSLDQLQKTPSNKWLMRSIDLAAMAMRSAKGNKQEHVVIFNPKLEKAEKIRTHVLASVDEAVYQNYHQVYFQPIIDIASNHLAEFEALSRWIDPTYGFLTPDQFINPLEDAHMIYKIDLNVLRQYGKLVQKLTSENKKVYPISFNISRTDLEAGINIYEEIEQIVRTYHLRKDLIHIEITESALNDSSERMKEAVNHFHELGYEVWMDDFGSGYSSLNVLKDYHFDVIKIDMVFLRHFDERSQTIIQSICEMAQRLSIRVVAEGVETKEQYAFLKQIGCTYAQGYLFSQPLPYDEISKKMQSYM